MKSIISLVYCVVITYGCKPVDRSQSENKGFASIGKKITAKTAKFGKLSDEATSSIKGLAKKIIDPIDREKGIRDMITAIKKGGKMSDEAVQTYVRAYNGRFNEWSELTAELNKKRSSLSAIKKGTNRAVDDTRMQIYQEIWDATTILTAQFQRRITQVEDILIGINVDPKQAKALAERLFGTNTDSILQKGQVKLFIDELTDKTTGVTDDVFLSGFEKKIPTRWGKIKDGENQLISLVSDGTLKDQRALNDYVKKIASENEAQRALDDYVKKNSKRK